MTEISPSIREWLKQCLTERFDTAINQKLNQKISIEDIVDEITKSTDVKNLMKSTESALRGQQDIIDGKLIEDNECGPITSLSYTSDLSCDDWSTFKTSAEQLSVALDNASLDKPIHVRLAGYETLLEGEINNCDEESINLLLKCLSDGISDDNRPIFEASVRVHAKLLESSRSHDVYMNLINAFDNEYHTEKLHEPLPNFNTGINFKIFRHEKLISILYIIIEHQKQILKVMRGVDRIVDEIIDQFVVFLNTHNVSNATTKLLSTLNLLAVLDPSANWSKKLLHSSATRKTLIAALSKSPNFLDNVLTIVKNGLNVCPDIIVLTITDEPPAVFISGDTVETLTYLHCLHFISQLCSYLSGRKLLSECHVESFPSPAEYLIALLTSLNTLALSTVPRAVYNESRAALKIMLNQPTLPCDSRFFHIALNPLMKNSKSSNKLWIHTIDVANFMLDTKDGFEFLTSEYRHGSANSQDINSIYPCSIILIYTSNLLNQPLTVMNIDQVVEIFKFIGKLFDALEDFDTVEEAMRNNFFPAIERFYNKIDKYSIGNESKTQYLDSAMKNMLLNIASSPLGLRLLNEHPIIFEELIESSINPLRYSWNSNEIVIFIVSAAFFDFGRKVISQLVPQTFSLFLSDVCENLQDPFTFVDPWDNENAKKFIHVLALLSLNAEFMLDAEENNYEEFDYPRSFCELLKCSINNNSSYHGFSLLALETMIWNLDISIHLLHTYDLQNILLELQEDCLMEVKKYQEKFEEHDDGTELELNEENENNQKIENEETHVVYVIDETSFIRHRILTNAYYIRHKLFTSTNAPEECVLYSNFPPPDAEENINLLLKSDTSSELDELLENCKPGLRDSGWISQVKAAHKNSKDPMKHSTLICLLDEMEKAIPTVEWVDVFKWEDELSLEKIWLPEDEFGLELAIRFSEDNCEKLEDELNAKANLKKVFELIHSIIKFERGEKFEGFDWFLATIFIICNGNVEKCKVFIKQLVRFPSAIFMWRTLGISVDRNNEEEIATQLILAEHIDAVVKKELPAVNYALKSEFGVKWWMICDRLLAQCFWCVLKWPEIVHFLGICISNTPDYIVYYCVSMLQHCEPIIMQDIIDKKSWPENMNLSEFRCHNYMGFMDRLSKRYGNKILASLTQRKVIIPTES
ncbi:hypothetical protein PV325_009132 [Microctonus aethiopoides]|nr:hypothetical protein PV325_009132 [Microctonus aethiopoides]